MRLLRKTVLSMITLCLLIPPLFIEVSAATEQLFSTQYIQYQIDQTKSENNIIYARTPSLTTKLLGINVGAGKVISKIEFLRAGHVVQTITPNSQTYPGTVTFTGVPMKLTTKKNKQTGGWMAYQRSSSESQWTVGNSQWGFIINERLPESQIHKSLVAGTMRDDYPGYRVLLRIPRSRNQPYYNDQGNDFPTFVIDNDLNRIKGWNPGLTGARLDSSLVTIQSQPQIKGTNDNTTTLESRDILSLDAVDFYIWQVYDHVGLQVDLPAAGAAMMYYFFQMEFDLVSYTYQYPNEVKVYSTDGTDPCVANPNAPGCGNNNNPGGGGSGGGADIVCEDPSPSGAVREATLNDPNVSAVIKADSRGSERFNVLDGIPTSESLYGNVHAKSYLSKHKFIEMQGKCSFDVTVNRTYDLTWDPGKPQPLPGGGTTMVPDPQSDTDTLTKSYTIEREYSFWVIDQLEVYKIDEARLWNYAFNGGGIAISPDGYIPPYYSSSSSSGYIPPNPPNSINAQKGSKSGGTQRPDISGEDLSSFAESAVDKIRVSNDSLTFNGTIIMNGSETETSGPAPETIPVAPQIGSDVLYKPGNMIPATKENRADQPSTGTIYYGLMSGNINGGDNKSFPIYGINPVTVHTPVVIYPKVSDDQAHNQRTRPASGRSAIILDRPFTVFMPNSGQHTNYVGYGKRNYIKYIESKQIRFPFDVYDETKTSFYPKNEWITVNKSRESFTFNLPVWVDEGYYHAEFRSIAENSPSQATHQRNANLDLTHHIAYDTVPVDVIGRVYDFRVTDIADYNWETVFRAATGQAAPTGVSYWVGMHGIDGASRNTTSRYTLPIRPGSHPLYKNAVIKTGYHFKFDLKTKGNMFGKLDQLTITPAFYYINPKNGIRIPIDLYYHTGQSNYVKIGSPRDTVQRYVILNERLRNVPEEELINTALFKYDHYYTFGQIAGISRTQFVKRYISKMAKQKTGIGHLNLLRLTEEIRTFIGSKSNLPSGVDPARANASVQKWYGEYSLPADLYAVPAGTNVAEYGRTHQGLTDQSPLFLKNGYIVVNFNIETVQDGNTANPHLQYIAAPLMNQWFNMEGFRRSVIDSYGRTLPLMDGDVVFYDTNHSSRDDFRPLVTH